LELGTVLGAQVDGAASRFQLETPSGRLREVLTPRPFTASLGLAWGYGL